MAAAVSPRPSSAFDLRTSAPYPIRLSPDASACSSIQYNHKPHLSDPERAESSLNTASNGRQVTLSLKDGADEYKYSGRRQKDPDAYVLLLDEEGKEFVLEKVESLCTLNLARTPWESDARALSQSYPQLHAEADDEDGEDLFGDTEEGGVALEGDADDDNPFDFRHYLDVAESPSPPLQPAKAAPVATPAASQSSTRTNTPLARSSRKQTSAFAPQTARAPPKARTKPKPVETQPEPKPSTRSPSPEPQRRRREEIDVPAVRLDRRASTRMALPPKPAPQRPKQRQEPDELSLDDDNNGDLILEGDEPPRSASYHAKSSLGLAFANQLGDGPRSLRSAASSPAASYTHSPAPRRPSPLGENQHADDEEDAEIDPDEEPDRYHHEVEAESDVDEDDDVDALKLPSPAQAHRASTSAATVTADDDEEDLVKQMRLELEGGLEQAESDEESEEE